MFYVSPTEDDFKLSSYDYFLPRESIAQEPTVPRDESKLLVIFRDGIWNAKFKDVSRFFDADDLLVFNATRVVKTKLIGKKETGGHAEVTVIEKHNDGWLCFVHCKNPKVGLRLIFPNSFVGEIREQKGKHFIIRFNKPLLEYIDAFGKYTLPGYIKQELKDPEMYQTVYSEKPGSLAAPTAGLHFTEELLNSLKNKGVDFAKVYLDVGLGTFEPVTSENILEHEMHYEHYLIDKENLALITDAINSGKRIFAVGTTSVRALESAFSHDHGEMVDERTNLFIYPGYRFHVPYYALITNFHIPKSSLIMLVSAFVGRTRILKIYQYAVEHGYRFYSLGDATMIIDADSKEYLSDFSDFVKI